VRLPVSCRGGTDGRGVAARGPQHSAPARYTEASLVKRSRKWVGRPSTYATIMDTVQTRAMPEKRQPWSRLDGVRSGGLPGAALCQPGRLRFHRSDGRGLDGIAAGRGALPWLTRFYFGHVAKVERLTAGLKRMVAERLADIDARAVNSISIGDPGDGVVLRVGRFGPTSRRVKEASVPEISLPDELTVERARELLEAPPAERSDRETWPRSRQQLPSWSGPGVRPYVQLGVPRSWARPSRKRRRCCQGWSR